jgi:transketolase
VTIAPDAADGTACGGYLLAEAAGGEGVACVRALVSIEAGIAQGWRAFVGDAGECISLEHFGASAACQVLFGKFWTTAERAAAAARTSLATVAQLAAGDQS